MQLTTMEIAARCGKSERTIQRWIQKGILPAQQIEGNRYQVNESDLVQFLPRLVTDDLVQRLAQLESRVAELEQIVHKKRPAPTGDRPQEWEEGYVPIVDLIKQYNAPETTVMRNMRPYLKTGPWHTSDGRIVRYALDAEGVAEFMRRYGRTN